MRKIKKIFAAGPSITNHEINVVNNMMKNHWDDYTFVEKFERNFSNFHKRKYGLMTPSCTLAIHLILKTLRLKKNDEIIVPITTWTASIAPIVDIGAKPVFVDVKYDSWCIDDELIEEKITKKTKAILAVDLYGNMPSYKNLIKICKKYKLFLIEDAAEGLGSTYYKQKAGKFGIASVHSFHRTKTISTGEGGFLLIDDKKIFQRAKKLRDLGRSLIDPYIAEEVSLKYMPSNLQAAMGCAQLDRIKDLLKIKKNIFNQYSRTLKKNKISFSANISDKTQKNGYWATTIVYDKKYKIDALKLILLLKKKNIPARNFFAPLTMQKAYLKFKKNKENFPVAKNLYKSGITLPCHYKLTNEQIKFICDTISEILKSKISI